MCKAQGWGGHLKMCFQIWSPPCFRTFILKMLAPWGLILCFIFYWKISSLVHLKKKGGRWGSTSFLCWVHLLEAQFIHPFNLNLIWIHVVNAWSKDHMKVLRKHPQITRRNWGIIKFLSPKNHCCKVNKANGNTLFAKRMNIFTCFQPS